MIQVRRRCLTVLSAPSLLPDLKKIFLRPSMAETDETLLNGSNLFATPADRGRESCQSPIMGNGERIEFLLQAEIYFPGAGQIEFNSFPRGESPSQFVHYGRIGFSESKSHFSRIILQDYDPMVQGIGFRHGSLEGRGG
jgi:hypothetical protein